MTELSLLKFAETHRPIYFEPGTDVEVYDEDDEVWIPLFASSYSLPSVIESLSKNRLPPNHIRFPETIAEEYLHHLKETGFDEQLHHEDVMNRERLVAFADAGYTTVDDFLGTADPIDIARDTGVNRDIISSLATNYLDGFSTGSSLGNAGPFNELSPIDSFTGWILTKASPNLIRWVSTGRFNLTLRPTPDGSTTITCNAPEAKQNAWYRKGHSIEIGPDESLDAEGALQQAHDWLDTHELEYEDDLAQLPHIGAATKDYLALEYGIRSIDALREFAEENTEAFSDIFGSPGEELMEALEE